MFYHTKEEILAIINLGLDQSQSHPIFIEKVFQYMRKEAHLIEYNSNEGFHLVRPLKSNELREIFELIDNRAKSKEN